MCPRGHECREEAGVSSLPPGSPGSVLELPTLFRLQRTHLSCMGRREAAAWLCIELSQGITQPGWLKAQQRG